MMMGYCETSMSRDKRWPVVRTFKSPWPKKSPMKFWTPKIKPSYTTATNRSASFDVLSFIFQSQRAVKSHQACAWMAEHARALAIDTRAVVPGRLVVGTAKVWWQRITNKWFIIIICSVVLHRTYKYMLCVSVICFYSLLFGYTAE